MKITNKYGLPGAIVEAINGFGEEYDASHTRRSDISVTSLISPPQQVELRRKHRDELEEDASERLWALMGNAVHSLLEKTEPSAIVEERLYGYYNGWTLSGKFDRMTLRQVTLQDYKFMSVWEYVFGLKPERVAQLNVLAQLAIDNGYTDISKLEVVGLLRDWMASKAETEANYPKVGLVRIPVELWPEEQRKAYIAERIAAHRAARDGQIIPCSADDTWYSGDTFAVKKPANKRALRVFPTKPEAEAFLQSAAGCVIETRPGEHKRCARYCNVADFCPQWQATKPTETTTEAPEGQEA